MDIETFSTWLKENKGYSEKASRDVFSRLKRILIFTGEDTPSINTIKIADANEEFTKQSMSVKSQMRRAVRLALEYLG